MINARTHLQNLVGQEIWTLTQRKPNRILRLDGEEVVVATRKSRNGESVPIEWVQQAINTLVRSGVVEVTVEDLGHRGAFIDTVFTGGHAAGLPPRSP